jgi:peptide/nickel transport system permease protein
MTTTDALGERALGGAAAPSGPASEGGEAILGRTQWQIFWRRFRSHKMAVVSIIVLFALAFLSIFGPSLPITPEDVKGGEAANPLLISSATSVAQAPTADHPFGVANAGHDVMRLIWLGGRISLTVGLAVALISVIVGSLVGALAGFFGGWIDYALMRVTDVLFAIPPLPLQLAFASVALQESGPLSNFLNDLGSTWRTVIVISLLSWMPVARLVRAEFLSLKEREFVQAARALGASRTRIIVRHMLPNSVGAIVVNGTLTVALAILTEAALSFLGVGANNSWGQMIINGVRDSLSDISNVWWLILYPGAFIIITVLSVNFIGDGLRDALDPYGKR